MASHVVPITAMSLEEHSRRLKKEYDKEVERFAKRAGNAVLRHLRDKEYQLPVDSFLIKYVAGMLRQHGVQADYIDPVTRVVVEEYARTHGSNANTSA